MSKVNCVNECVAYLLGIPSRDMPLLSWAEQRGGVVLADYFSRIEPFLAGWKLKAQYVEMQRGVTLKERCIEIQKREDLDYLHAVVVEDGSVVLDTCMSYQGCCVGWVRLVKASREIANNGN